MKTVRNAFLFLWFLGLVGLFNGCRTFTTAEIKEGTIEYDITYPFPEQITMSPDLMPKTMVFKFRDAYTLSEISAGLGVFNTYVLTDAHAKKITQRLKVMGKKYKVEFDSLQIDSIIRAEPPMSVKLTGNKKKLGGYTCEEAICTFKDPEKKPYHVYFTNDIKTEQSNWYSVYRGISGTMMEFYVNRYGITMKLTVKNVSKEGLEEDTFAEDQEYATIPYHEMDSYFKMY